MGEIAEMMLDGTLCERCGVALDGESPGYPRHCEDCGEGDADWADRKARVREAKVDRLRRFDQTGWMALSEHHFRKMMGNVRFDYWPSTSKVEWRGRIYHGVDPDDIQHFIDNRTDR